MESGQTTGLFRRGETWGRCAQHPPPSGGCELEARSHGCPPVRTGRTKSSVHTRRWQGRGETGSPLRGRRGREVGAATWENGWAVSRRRTWQVHPRALPQRTNSCSHRHLPVGAPANFIWGAVINYHKLRALKGCTWIPGSSNSEEVFLKSEMNIWAGVIPCGGSREGCVSLPSLSSGSCLFSLPHAHTASPPCFR